MNKKVSLFGMIFAVAFVAMASSWLNSVEVNATTVLDFFKANSTSSAEVNKKRAEDVQEELIFDGMVPLVLSLEDAMQDGISLSETLDEYRAKLEATQAELQETRALFTEMQVEIDLLKSTAKESPDTTDKELESDESTGEDADDEVEEEVDSITTANPPAPSHPASSGTHSSGAPGMTEAQIWQQQFDKYQEWAKQYETKADDK